ncbi:MAG TPA: hypothetical protein VGD55_02840 [Acidothermaceae bacterium]
MRTAALASMLAALVATLAGCASVGSARTQGSGSPGSSAVAVFTPTPGEPLKLVGSWLLDAPGEPLGTVLRLGDDLSIWSDCGELMGDWAANPAGLFAAQVAGWSGSCVASTSTNDPTPTWLKRVVGFKADAAREQLLDATGAVVATLRPGGQPTAGPDISADLTKPPTVTDSLRARLRGGQPLPAGLVAARPAELVGRWVWDARPIPRGFAQLAFDGSWTGSDGANGQGGRWSAALDGELVVVAGAQTLAGCGDPAACADVGGSFGSAARAAFDGSTLVLLDADGKVTGRLVRAPAVQAVAPASSAGPQSPAPTSALASDTTASSSAASSDVSIACRKSLGASVFASGLIAVADIRAYTLGPGPYTPAPSAFPGLSDDATVAWCWTSQPEPTPSPQDPTLYVWWVVGPDGSPIRMAGIGGSPGVINPGVFNGWPAIP